MNKKRNYVLLGAVFLIAVSSLSFINGNDKDNVKVSLKEQCAKNLYVLCNDLINIQNMDSTSPNYGALYCKACSVYHTRASESVLPFTVAYKESGNKKYLKSAILTESWLIKQQHADGSWFETPSDWQGTTTDQLLSLSASYPIIKSKLSKKQAGKWKTSIKSAADWIVKNMSPEYASINYCATSTASLMLAYQVVKDSAYLMKAKKLAMEVIPKFDGDYFLEGEGNRIRGTKYGVDLGYSMDMALWGLGLYAKLNKDVLIDKYVRQALKRYIYFIYPDGSTDGSWGVRASKWTTYGSFTADGCQILFGLYSKDNAVYKEAALLNMKYFMKMDVGGLLTYGPDYYEIFNKPPCIYPTFCRAKNLALTILYGDQSKGYTQKLPTQKIGWLKYFETMDLALVRTKNFMVTVTGYRYKDIRRGATFKYMYRPSGGSITNLWAKDYGCLQASSETEYHKWEMNYPVMNDSAITITPRIEFKDSTGYYTNLYDFDSHIETSDSNGVYIVKTIGELKDKNRWEGGVAYVLTHKISDDYIEKDIKLRFHGRRPNVNLIEPFIKDKNTIIKKLDNYDVEISRGNKKFIFSLLTKDYKITLGMNESEYEQPFPAFKGYPITINVKPLPNSFTREIKYRIEIKNS
jgi:hypothetical protein